MIFKDTLKNLKIPTYTMNSNGELVETIPNSESLYYSTLKAKEVNFTANERQQRKTGFDLKGKTDDFYEFVKKTVKKHFPDAVLREERDILIFDEKHIGFQYCDLLKYSEKYFGYKRDTLQELHQKYEDQGIRVIHIFSDEWINRTDICKSIIRASIGIFKERYYARKCRVEYITKEQGIEFFNANHLQGNGCATWYIGAFSGDTLIAVLSIGSPRFTNFANFEVVRYAVRRDCQAVGAFMKCFDLFKKDHVGTIVTYSDSRIFSANIYRNNFIEDKSSQDLDYFYTNGTERFNRFKFQKFKLVKAYPEFEKITEHNCGEILNAYRIYGLKQYRFIYKW